MRSRNLLVIAIATAIVIIAPGLASAAIKIRAIFFDPPGSDTPAKLNQEYVVLENTGNNRINLDGWKLRDQANHVYHFVDFKLAAGHKVRVRTGHGQDDGNDVYQDSGSYIWNNDGDKATLRKDNGTVADSCSYTASASSPKTC